LQNKENDQNNKQTEMEFLKAVNIIGRDLDEAMALLEQLNGISGPELAEIKLARSRVQSASDLLKLLPDMDRAKAVTGAVAHDSITTMESAAVKVTEESAPVQEHTENPVPIPEPEPEPAPVPVPEAAHSTEPVYEQVVRHLREPVAEQKSEPMPVPAPEPEPAKQPAATQKNHEASKAIFADRFSQAGTLGDKISPAKQDESISSSMHSKPIADIGAAIGINDRFYFIRELFSGDALAYSDTIRRLNNSASLGDAMRILDESTVMGSDPAAQSSFVDVVRRKFSLNV
jgi:outer membrane biosynthesis protein TonB